MEVREIMVANTKTQTRKKIMTGAETLGELKSVLDSEGIDYAGMTFTEGLSKTSLLDDSSPLPKDVMFKGAPTNNLVILLTNTKKNIASGSESRNAAYQRIREENLQDAIKEEFGRNFTQVSTQDLWEFIDEALGDEDEDIEEDEDVEEEEENTEEDTEDTPVEIPVEKVPQCLACSIEEHVKLLVKAGILGSKELHSLIDQLEELYYSTKEIEGSVKTKVGNIEVSEDDIDEMLSKI